VRALEHDERFARIVDKRSGKLRFFTSNDIGNACAIDALRAGNNRELRFRRAHERLPEATEIHGTAQIVRFDPTLSAPDHSAGDSRQ